MGFFDSDRTALKLPAAGAAGASWQVSLSRAMNLRGVSMQVDGAMSGPYWNACVCPGPPGLPASVTGERGAGMDVGTSSRVTLPQAPGLDPYFLQGPLEACWGDLRSHSPLGLKSIVDLGSCTRLSLEQILWPRHCSN